MQAAQVLAGYSLGEADLLRRAMGKKIQSEMDAQRATLRRGLRRAQRHPRGQGQRAVRLDRQVRRLRLQQEPRRGLCAARLPDRLAEGASPRRILRRLDELRHGADRQAGDLRRGHAPRRGRVPAARHQRQPRAFHGRGRRGPLRARRAQGRRREGDGGAGRGARAGRPFASLEDFAARIDPRLLNRRQLESLAGAGAFDELKPDRAAVFAARRDDPRPCRQRARAARPAARPGCSAAIRREARADPPAARRRVDAGPADGGRARRLRLLFLGPSGRCASATCSPRTRSRPSPSSPRSSVAEGERLGARWLALIEEARWRVSARGRRYMIATLSRPLGPIRSRRCSTTSRRAALEAAAKAGAVRAADRRARSPRRATRRRGSRSSASSL